MTFKINDFFDIVLTIWNFKYILFNEYLIIKVFAITNTSSSDLCEAATTKNYCWRRTPPRDAEYQSEDNDELMMLLKTMMVILKTMMMLLKTMMVMLKVSPDTTSESCIFFVWPLDIVHVIDKVFYKNHHHHFHQHHPDCLVMIVTTTNFTTTISTTTISTTTITAAISTIHTIIVLRILRSMTWARRIWLGSDLSFWWWWRAPTRSPQWLSRFKNIINDDVGGDGDDDNDDDATLLVEIIVPSQRDQMGPEVWANAALQKRPEQVSGEFHPWNLKS